MFVALHFAAVLVALALAWQTHHATRAASRGNRPGGRDLPAPTSSRPTAPLTNGDSDDSKAMDVAIRLLGRGHVRDVVGRRGGTYRTPLTHSRPLFPPHHDPNGLPLGDGLDGLDEDTRRVVRAFLGKETTSKP